MLENNLTGIPVLFGEIQREILDVRKEEQDKVIEPTLKDELVVPDTPMQTLGSVLVKGVTANIDENIKPENIKLGTTILGVQGNVAPDKPDQEKTIYPSEEEQIVVGDTGFELAKVIAKPVETESLEILPTKEKQTINASEGKYIKQFEVLGVETEELNIAPTTEEQTFTPSENKFFDKVTIDAVEDLDPELTEQETKLAKLEEDVNALSDKPTDMLQQRVDLSRLCKYLFYYYPEDTLDYIGGLDVSKVTSMESMFAYASNLISLDLSTFVTNNVGSMSSMFANCSRLTNVNISSFNTEKVTSMVSMFDGCESLTTLNLSNFNTENLKNMASMFVGCDNLTDLNISSFNTSNVENMSNLFTSCKSFVEMDISHFNTNVLENTSGMFRLCNKLTTIKLPNFSSGTLTNISRMFESCTLLESVDLTKFNTENVTTMSSMFLSCSNLKSLDFANFNTTKVTKMDDLVRTCSKLETLINLDMINAPSTSTMINNCSVLTNLILKNIKKSIVIGSSTSWGHLLTNESLINTFKELWDLTGSTKQTLYLSTTSKTNIANIYVKLVDITDEMLTQDQYAGNKKPCVVCEPTDDGAMTLTEYATSKNWAIA